MSRRTRMVLAAVASFAMAGALVGCSQSSTSSDRVEITAPENPGTSALVMPKGSIDAAVKGLPDLVERVMHVSKIPGMAVAVVHDGKMVFARGFGVKKVGEPGAIDPYTVFQLASLSKSVGATVVATQVTQSVVRWDTPIVQEMPDFTLADPWVTAHATVGDLYAHRTGLPHAAGDLLEDIGYDRDYVLSHLKYEPLSPFRTTYAYANFGTTVGAEAAARAAGTDWATLSQQQLYEPLGMDSTSSRFSDYMAQKNRAIPHAKIGDTFKPLFQRDPDAQSPAGGVSSNVVDMSKWMNMVLANGKAGGKQVISPKALVPAISPQAFTGHPTDVTSRVGTYGFGFNVGTQPGGRVMLSHSGAFALGAGTAFSMLPSADVGIVALTNGAPVGAAESVTTEFMDDVQFGHATRDWWKIYHPGLANVTDPAGDLVGKTAPSSPAAAAPLTAFVGEYHNDFYGTITIREDSGKLVVAMGPDGGYTFPLTHWDGNDFSFVPTGENAPHGSLSSANFVVNDGVASAVTMGFFNANKLGTWTR